MRAITSNAPVSLAITDMPVDASLTLFAMNDLGPVNVTLPPTYQGPFSLKTTAPSFPQVLWPDASLKDPTGRGRPLVRGELGFDEHGAMKGEVRWGAVTMGPSVRGGLVDIGTTGGEAVLGWEGASGGV